MALTDARIRNLTLAPGRSSQAFSDREGLYVFVRKTGTKSFRYNYIFDGRQKTITYGKYPSTSLARARELHAQAKATLAKGEDPLTAQRALRAALRQAREQTFENWAHKWLAHRRLSGLSEATLRKDEYFVALLVPAIGSTPIAEVSNSELLKVISEREKARQFEVARRLREKAGKIFAYAIAAGMNNVSNVASAIKGATITPPPTAGYHFISDPERLGYALAQFRAYSGNPTVRYALMLVPHLMLRQGELRMAKWSFLNLANKELIIPAELMKQRRQPHIVPLTEYCIEIFQKLHQHTGNNAYIFQGQSKKPQPFSENTLNLALRRLGFPKEEVSIHGFRKTASTLLNELNHDPYLIELQLSHAVPGIAGIYNKAQRLDSRRELMNAWSSYLLDLERQVSKELVDAH